MVALKPLVLICLGKQMDILKTPCSMLIQMFNVVVLLSGALPDYWAAGSNIK